MALSADHYTTLLMTRTCPTTPWGMLLSSEHDFVSPQAGAGKKTKVRVGRVTQGSPAHLAGVRVGDFIENVNGCNLNDIATDPHVLATRALSTIKATMIVRPASFGDGALMSHQADKYYAAGASHLAYDVQIIRKKVSKRWGIHVKMPHGDGVVIEVEPQGLAHRCGVRSGDKVMAVNGISLHQPGEDPWKSLCQFLQHSCAVALRVEPLATWTAKQAAADKAKEAAQAAALAKQSELRQMLAAGIATLAATDKANSVTISPPKTKKSSALVRDISAPRASLLANAAKRPNARPLNRSSNQVAKLANSTDHRKRKPSRSLDDVPTVKCVENNWFTEDAIKNKERKANTTQHDASPRKKGSFAKLTNLPKRSSLAQIQIEAS